MKMLWEIEDFPLCAARRRCGDVCAHPAYADGFALECEALRMVRETMGLTNLVIMMPFCRCAAEAEAEATGISR